MFCLYRKKNRQKINSSTKWQYICAKNNMNIKIIFSAEKLSNYSWCNQVLWSPQMVRKNTSRRWDLRLEVRSPIGGDTSDWRWHLQSEVPPPIGGPTSDWRWDLQSEVPPPIGSTHVTCKESVILLKKKEIIYCWLHQAVTCLPGEM